MSIINDMLRDLDDRSAPAGDTFNLKAATTQAKPSPTRLILISLVILAMSVIAVNLGFNEVSQPAPQIVSDEEERIAPGLHNTLTEDKPGTDILVHENLLGASQPDTQTEPYLNNEKELPEQPMPALTLGSVENGERAESETSPGKGVSLNSAQELQNQRDPIPEYLAQAEYALAHNRLTRPAGASAYDYYKKVLAIAPNHAAAAEGLQTVNERYAEFIQAQIEKGNLKRAEVLISRAQHFKFALDEQNFQAQLERAQQDQQQVLAENSSNRVSITPTLNSQDAAVAETAWRSFNAGREQPAISSLQAFLTQYPQARQTRIRLFEIHILQKDYPAALRLCDYLNDQPVQQQFMRARVFAAQGLPQQALQQLEATGSRELKDMLAAGVVDKKLFEQYSALQAAIYQATKNHLAAVEKYQMLVAFAPDNASYWLGYAVSSDALSHYENALGAYQRLAISSNLEKKLRTFVNERVSSLKKLIPENSGDVATGDF